MTDQQKQRITELEAENARLKCAIKNVRQVDCGGWLKDCQSTLFTCNQGHGYRLTLLQKLDELYAEALAKVVNHD